MRMALLVCGALLLISACIVISINTLNLHSIRTEMFSALDTLCENDGQRVPAETPPPKLDQEPKRLEGQPLSVPAASLSNYYTIRIDESGEVIDWDSDRRQLYSEEQIAELAAQILASGDSKGRILSQFYLVSLAEYGKQIVVIDARSELAAASRLLTNTMAVTAIAYVLLAVGAILLIRRMTQPIDEAFRKQKQFVWDASHELKTPLAVISANAEVLSAEIGENESLNYIRSEISRTDKLIQNLLTLARMDNGTVKARFAPFDLSRALLSVALPFESTVFEAGKTLKIEVPENIMFTGDEAMIQQLAVILLDNALKYSDPKTEICLRAESGGFGVHNFGTPIPKDDQQRIFDRFYRADSAHNRETGGNGLGLAIAASIAQAHRAKITVASDSVNGTTFWISPPK